MSTPTPSSRYTGPTAEDLDRIPAALKARPQWVLWRGADRVDRQTGAVKLNKIPIDPQTLRNADPTDPATWGTFEQCVTALPVALEGWQEKAPRVYRGGGLGFVFAAAAPYAGVDLDGCRNPETGTIVPWAQEIIDQLATYAELSSTETGVHLIAQGDLPPGRRKKGAIEMYASNRFFTMTGYHLSGTPPDPQPRPEALKALHMATFSGKATAQQRKTPAAAQTIAGLLDDAALLDKARNARKASEAAQVARERKHAQEVWERTGEVLPLRTPADSQTPEEAWRVALEEQWQQQQWMQHRNFLTW